MTPKDGFLYRKRKRTWKSWIFLPWRFKLRFPTQKNAFLTDTLTNIISSRIDQDIYSDCIRTYAIDFVCHFDTANVTRASIRLHHRMWQIVESLEKILLARSQNRIKSRGSPWYHTAANFAPIERYWSLSTDPFTSPCFHYTSNPYHLTVIYIMLCECYLVFAIVILWFCNSRETMPVCYVPISLWEGHACWYDVNSLIRWIFFCWI